MRKSVAKPCNRTRSGLTSLPARPGLRLAEERAKLGEKRRRRRTSTVERLDPREPLEDRA